MKPSCKALAQVGHDDVVEDLSLALHMARKQITCCINHSGVLYRGWLVLVGENYKLVKVSSASQVKSAMFSYDGMRIITASMDGTARVEYSAVLLLIVGSGVVRRAHRPSALMLHPLCKLCVLQVRALLYMGCRFITRH